VIIKTKADLLDGPQILKSVVQAQIYIYPNSYYLSQPLSQHFSREKLVYSQVENDLNEGRGCGSLK